MTHKHQWKPFQMDAVGYYQKRDCPGSEVYFDGHVDICTFEHCFTLRFVCEDPRLQIVECDIDNEPLRKGG